MCSNHGEALESLRTAARHLVGRVPDSGWEAVEESEEILAAIDLLEAALALRVPVVEASGVLEEWGFRSAKQWLRQHCSRFVPARGMSGRQLDALGQRSTPSERTQWFRTARDWLAKSGLHGVHGDLLAYTAAEIRSALLVLRRVTTPGPDVRVLHAACPTCRCLGSLRVDVAVPNRLHWVVRCYGPDCDTEWPLDRWNELGELIGVDVREAVQES